MSKNFDSLRWCFANYVCNCFAFMFTFWFIIFPCLSLVFFCVRNCLCNFALFYIFFWFYGLYVCWMSSSFLFALVIQNYWFIFLFYTEKRQIYRYTWRKWKCGFKGLRQFSRKGFATATAFFHHLLFYWIFLRQFSFYP